MQRGTSVENNRLDYIRCRVSGADSKGGGSSFANVWRRNFPRMGDPTRPYKRTGPRSYTFWQLSKNSKYKTEQPTKPYLPTGCGAQGEIMHPRDSCPATALYVFSVERQGNYRSVCRSQQRSQRSPGMYNDVQHQPYYHPPTSYQPPPSYSTSQKMDRVNEVSEGQADPTPMMHNIIVIPQEGGQQRP